MWHNSVLTQSHSSVGDRSRLYEDIDAATAKANFGQFKATFDGLQVMITAMKRVKPIVMSDFDRNDLEILYRVKV